MEPRYLWNPGIFGWCFLMLCLQNWPINPNTFLPLRGSRVLPPQIMPFFFFLIIVSWILLRNRKLKKSILPPLYLTKRIHIKTTTPCSRSVADLRNLGKSVRFLSVTHYCWVAWQEFIYQRFSSHPTSLWGSNHFL